MQQYYIGPDGKPYQMPPIVQPVAFVPYVTQEQPLMQYSPIIEDKKPQKPVANNQNNQNNANGQNKSNNKK